MVGFVQGEEETDSSRFVEPKAKEKGVGEFKVKRETETDWRGSEKRSAEAMGCGMSGKAFVEAREK